MQTHLHCKNLPLNKLYGNYASFQNFHEPVFSWSNFPLLFFKMAITDVTAWAVKERINKVVSPLEYVHGSREAPGSAKRVVDFLSLQCLT